MNKRTFLRNSVYLAAGSPFLLMGCGNEAAETSNQSVKTTAVPEEKMPYLDTIGLQLYTVREQMKSDPETTLRAIKDLGYHQVELMDTRDAAKLLPICRDLDLKVNSSFMLWTTITGRWDLVPDEKEKFAFENVLDQANEADLSHLVFGYIQPGERENLDAYRKLADQLNEAGLKAKERGLQMAYHNHNFEFERMGPAKQFPLQVLAERLEADLVPFELDVFWAAIAGVDPVGLLPTIKERVKLLHLKDLKPKTEVTTALDGIPEDAFQELGDGSLPIKKLAQMGKEYGVDYCFVEQDQSPAPLESIAQSIDFLR